MKKSILILEEISQKCYNDTTVFKYNKDSTISKKYKKGRVDASTWINELIYHYVQKEKNFLNKFKQHIKDQKEIIAIIKNGDYKQGLYDQLQIVESRIDDSIN